MGRLTKILVTGANGQLGQCLQKIAHSYPQIRFYFKDKNSLNITQPRAIQEAFQKGRFDYCINTAAFTYVDAAEQNPAPAYAVNAEGVKNLAEVCRKYRVCLVHISTDYVFDGEKIGGYTPEDMPNPINVYGRSKWEGEKHIRQLLECYFIVRTSWLYSEFGPNFYTKILEKARRGETLYVTDAQKGCPTDANHLAEFIMNLICDRRTDYGIKHFTDGDAMSWYEFACRIVQENHLSDRTKVVRDDNYRSFAARPSNSVLM